MCLKAAQTLLKRAGSPAQLLGGQGLVDEVLDHGLIKIFDWLFTMLDKTLDCGYPPEEYRPSKWSIDFHALQTTQRTDS